MAKPRIESILAPIAQSIFTCRNLDQARTLIKEHIQSHNIQKEDARAILDKTDACHSLPRLQEYFCNSLLYFEGMSTKEYSRK